ncbi:hypothetical protein K2173_014906 [Erythroxylum novogranatense]|uniref:Uncharacterized protein n=1 Tax=Erythroxylum novogranatense TaxID=1862640 RepID=A0AAV8THX5_9ROSI|nr:hypothetical protein K2173_014906 [Erythroxylum novogranatense]
MMRDTSHIMSKDELKIRGELEMDIERDLEQEIKDGIYHLAIRLHHLYQQQKERNVREVSESGTDKEKKNRTFSEVNITIKLEGGTKVEIKESKKEIPKRGRPKTRRSDHFHGVIASKTSKFDWAKSLRS